MKIELNFFMKILKNIMIWIVAIIGVLVVATVIVINQPQFARNPRGARLERIKKSPQWRDGQFRNAHKTERITGDHNFFSAMYKFFTNDTESTPKEPMPAVKRDLKNLDPNRNVVVWFGHSSYLLQVGGKRILVDPVFYTGAPFSFAIKPFPGTDIYKPSDMPEIDYLVITHNHYDHLNYKTVKELLPKVKHVVCTLGVGENMEYWGYQPEKITELDWWEKQSFDDGLTFTSTPTRHFSGRSLSDSGQMLWGAFVLQHDSTNIYIGGDSGYDDHYKTVGERFGHIDLAFVENGQYNLDWRYIHTLPEFLVQKCQELNAKHVISVHHGKFALANHTWDEPYRNINSMRKHGINMLDVMMGEIVEY